MQRCGHVRKRVKTNLLDEGIGDTLVAVRASSVVRSRGRSSGRTRIDFPIARSQSRTASTPGSNERYFAWHARKHPTYRLFADVANSPVLNHGGEIAGAGHLVLISPTNQYQSTMDALPWVAYCCVIGRRQEKTAIEISLSRVVAVLF
jgi:hypothetical protein